MIKVEWIPLQLIVNVWPWDSWCNMRKRRIVKKLSHYVFDCFCVYTESGIHTLPQVLPTTNQLQLSSPKKGPEIGKLVCSQQNGSMPPRSKFFPWLPFMLFCTFFVNKKPSIRNGKLPSPSLPEIGRTQRDGNCHRRLWGSAVTPIRHGGKWRVCSRDSGIPNVIFLVVTIQWHRQVTLWVTIIWVIKKNNQDSMECQLQFECCSITILQKLTGNQHAEQ